MEGELLAEETRKEKISRLRKQARTDPTDDMTIEGEILFQEIDEVKGRVEKSNQGHRANRKLIRSLHIDCGVLTSVGGGGDVEEYDVPKSCTEFLVFVQLKTVGAVPVTILSAEAIDQKLKITYSADPGNDHVFYYRIEANGGCGIP
jgi:hypothetical protein